MSRNMTSQAAAVHPGEILWKNLMAPAAEALAQAIGVPSLQVEQLVREQAPITDDMAARLAHHFGTSAQFWRDLQKEYDASRLKVAGRARFATGFPGRRTLQIAARLVDFCNKLVGKRIKLDGAPGPGLSAARSI
jgi:addiction module HigA family antidote